MKQITPEQIQQVLQVVYQTNVTAQNFDALSKFFNDLPECEKECAKSNPSPKG